ncbi:DUF488 family protein [Mycetocola zhadangensis]|uniref:DUF488 domain-containing protein n=1 Tax=Mycetocola zhadangensis TaxID=1164595 RepID=A0A3L7J695_9MICO|nr:DUF488 domain-containing protein [Mycetocola zhadangensis]RLQ86030.1 DUF488 domain-containing protein [Mycetocola zhadangensis]
MGHVFTVGHSTQAIEQFVTLLAGYGITSVADVRTVPKSRHNRQFSDEALSASLGDRVIEYRHLPALGGLRRPSKDSLNAGWNNASFRGYADYMQTEAFANGLEELIALGSGKTVAVMCAEAVPWRCHRSLIGDALLIRDFAVDDVLSATSIRPHVLTGFARVDGLTITYPPVDGEA